MQILTKRQDNDGNKTTRPNIMGTFKHTSEYVTTLGKNFNEFKLEVSNKITVIQTKLMMYVAAGSIVMSVAVNYVAKAIGAK